MKTAWITFGAVSALMMSVGALAGDDDCECRPGQECPPPHCTKEECFNVVCHYGNSADQKCEAASTFIKKVTRDGGEVQDDGSDRVLTKLEVKCGGNLIYNDGARRFTDLLGTRIQGRTGPYPAIVLPRGELHEGHHYSASWLELGSETLRGACYIYTGQP